MSSKQSHNLSKLVTLKKAFLQVQIWREQQKTVVFTNGCFDILHAGHVEYLDQAKSLGDYLIVGINSDSSIQKIKGPNRPIVAQQDRIITMSGLSAVDLVVVFDEETPLRIISLLKPDIHTKGGDYQAKKLPEYTVVKSYGGEVKILPLRPGISTSTIIEKILKTYSA